MNRIYWTNTGKLRTERRYRELLSNWPVPVEEFRFPTAQGETFVLASGRASSPSLVLLHGGLSNSLCWMPFVRLAAPYFRTYSIDTIGDPGFSAPSRPSFATNAHADWLDEIWRTLSLTQAAVCGWSLGGWLALDFAIRHPANVRALAALAPAGIVPIHRSTVAKILALLLLGSRGRRQAFLFSMGFQYEGVPEDLTSFVDFSLFAQTAAIGRTKLPGLFTDDALRTIGVPTMLMIGERDVFFNARRTIRRVQACLPNAAVCCPTGVGHGLLGHIKPVLDFLMSTEPSDTLPHDLLSIPSS
jgi:pimeloyl-ACP methyl ester carboxylesterase